MSNITRDNTFFSRTNVMRVLFVLVVALLQCLTARSDQVVRFTLRTRSQMEAINSLAEETMMDVWQGPSVVIPTDIHVNDVTKKILAEKLREMGVSFRVIIEDLDKLIEQEQQDNAFVKSVVKSLQKNSVVGYFARVDEILPWMDNIASTYSIASTFSIGTSTEGRDIRVMKLSTGSNKPAIFFNSGLHAREWLTVATVTYMVNKLMNDYTSGDSTARSFLNKFDVYILPVANPDGYEYSFTNTRLWRKTRQRWSQCTGTDPNRNFDVQYGSVGASPNQCSETYRGPRAFSEPETIALRDFILSIRSNLKLYIDIHSYSEFWLVPWGYTRKAPRDDAEMMRVANIGATALRNVNGVRFLIGSPANILYAAAGGAFDWAKEVAGIKYSYCLELRPDRYSYYGFVVPTSTIRPSGEETYAAIIATANAIPL